MRIDDNAIRRLQWEAGRKAHDRLVAETAADDLAECPAHSCQLLADVLRQYLQAVGVRFVDPHLATNQIAIAMWAGVESLGRQGEAALDGIELDERNPVHPFLAPAYNLLPGILNAMALAQEPDELAAVRQAFEEALAAELADGIDSDLN